MTHSFKSHFFHLIWSTQGRSPWLSEKIEARLYPYVAGIIKRNNANLLAIGGFADHIHLLIEFKNIESYSSIIRTIKANSSCWIKNTFYECKNFAWQEGYASYSVSYSGVESVKKYIQKQKKHHKFISFESEYQRFLNKNNLKFDPRFIFG